RHQRGQRRGGAPGDKKSPERQFAHALAARLGMTIGQLTGSMGSAEFTEWMAYAAEAPDAWQGSEVAEAKADDRNAILAMGIDDLRVTMTARWSRTRPRRRKLDDFMPGWQRGAGERRPRSTRGELMAQREVLRAIYTRKEA